MVLLSKQKIYEQLCMYFNIFKYIRRYYKDTLIVSTHHKKEGKVSLEQM